MGRALEIRDDLTAEELRARAGREKSNGPRDGSWRSPMRWTA
jgi:hypothetical protein